MVKIIVGNIYSKVVGFIPDEVSAELDKVLSYKLEGAKFIPTVKSGQWDGVVRLYHKHKGQSFLTGLLAIIRETFKKRGVEFEILDRRERPAQNYSELAFIPTSDYEERDYQKLTIERAIKYTRGVLSMATGAGKTLVVTRLISEIKTYPFIFYVLTKDLMEQAHGVMSLFLNQPIGMIGDGKCDIKKITVCTIQTAVMALNEGNTKFKISDYSFDDEDKWDEKGIESAEKAAKIRKLIQIANGIYLDETHHISCRTAKDVFLASPNAYWRFGGTATPVRESGDDIMIQALLGSKIVDINDSYLITRSDLVKPYILMEPIDDSDIIFHSYQKIYEKCIAKNDKFNTHVADTVNHLVKRGLSVLVLVQRYDQGEYLMKLIPNSEFITGKNKSIDRTQKLQDLRDGKITLIGTTLVDEGINITGLDAVILAGGGKSQVRIFQRIGRSLRRDKKSTKQKDKAIVIIYEHKAKYLEKHAKKIRSILKKEPEFVIIDSKGPNFIFNEIETVLGLKKQTDLFNE